MVSRYVGSRKIADVAAEENKQQRNLDSLS